MKILLALISVISIHATELEEFQDSNLKFAADVYQAISQINELNFLVCPLSAQIILSLATVGAKANTAKQLSSCLHLPDDSKRIKSIFEKLSYNFDVKEPYQLSSANKIFLNDKCDVKDEYKEVAVNTFKSGIESMNFADGEKVAMEINRWVESKTNNKIKDLVKGNDINTDILALLVNALYFHGNWAYEFGDSMGYQDRFYVNENETVLIDLMTQRNDFNYYNNKEVNAEFLELPFVGNDVTMTFVLPKEKNGVSRLGKNISTVLSKQPLEKVDAIITIPKFKIESVIEFKGVLESLGVTDPFSKGANFDGISDVPLHIDNVIQKTFIEINEKGATAAAATEITLMMDSLPNVLFTVNRPFIYFLKHRSNGIMFVGRYCKP
ncbi:hypothetical protein PPYR_04153 [Photinus pyralis]|uniref:Serpin domain-containing protein n=2 Tax=Photinus pyralis TaxID=7054 RepID=A0A5N4AXC5_PHOPY|nr:serpin B4-like [Photinus pyralis]KAB0801967.1 hypothetical protein PPYR_04153 [Photinus pyralis]